MQRLPADRWSLLQSTDDAVSVYNGMCIVGTRPHLATTVELGQYRIVMKHRNPTPWY